MLLLLACELFDFLEKTPDYEYPFLSPKIAAEAYFPHFSFEGSNQPTNLDLQHNGLELSCGPRLVDATQNDLF